MSELLFTNKSDLVVIADKIREKAGISDSLSFPQGFVDSINGISGQGGGLSLNGVDVTYEVAKGHTVNVGDFVSLVNQGNTDELVYNTSIVGDTTVSFLDFIKLSDTKIFVIYKNTSNELLGCVGIVTDETITLQTSTKIADLNSTTYYLYCDLSVIDEGKVLVGFDGIVDGQNGSHVVVCDIKSDYSLTIGTPYFICKYNGISIYYEDGKVLVTCLNDTSRYYLKGILLKVDNMSLTLITSTTLTTNGWDYDKSQIYKLDVNKVLIIHKGNNNGVMNAMICEITDSGINVLSRKTIVSTTSVMGSANTQCVSACVLNSSTFVVVYRISSNNALKGKVCTIADDVITNGTEYDLNSMKSTAKGVSIIPIDETQFCVVHATYSTYSLSYLLCNIDGTTIEFGSSKVFCSNSGITDMTRSLKLKDGVGLTLHLSDSTNKYLAITKFSYGVGKRAIKYNGGSIIGVATESGTDIAEIKVCCPE